MSNLMPLSRAGRGDEPGLYQEPKIGRQAVGPNATEARILIKSDPLSQHPSLPPLAVPNQTSSFAGGYWLMIITTLAPGSEQRA